MAGRARLAGVHAPRHPARLHRLRRRAGPGQIIIVASPGGFDQFVAAAGEPAPDLRLPVPVPPDPARLTRLATAHGIQILPRPNHNNSQASCRESARASARRITRPARLSGGPPRRPPTIRGGYRVPKKPRSAPFRRQTPKDEQLCRSAGMCALSLIFFVTQRDVIGGFGLSHLARGRGSRLWCLAPGGWSSPARCIAR